MSETSSAAPAPGERVPDLVYDVGMHEGEDAEFYLKKGFRVVGFEADPALADACRRRFAAEIDDGRLVVVEGAIVDRETAAGADTVRFYRNPDHSVWGTVVESWTIRNEQLGTRSEPLEVAVVDFVDCLRRYGVPYYLKIDIEGMDAVCLRALGAFAARPDYVSIEAEKTDFARLEADLELLAELGYTAFQAVQQSNVFEQREPDPAGEGTHVGHRFTMGASGLFGRDLPPRWQDRRSVHRRFRSIFVEYRWFGDDAPLSRHALGRWIIRGLARLAGRPVPGWYDLHARYPAAERPGRSGPVDDAAGPDVQD